MTDEELSISDATLIARLRDGCNLQQRDGERAAKRIEQLIATNEALTEQLAAARKDVDEVEAYAWELEQRLPTSEKLAAYRATLAEIKGENHE